jgi:aspartate-semialdehyde dehydrogenase
MTARKNSTGARLGIVNPLTLVGNEIRSILRERAFPTARIALLDSTGTGAGALTEVNDEPMIVAAASADELEDLDLVFFCGPPSGNRDLVEHAGSGKFIAVDLSQPSTAEEGKLAIAGMNLDDLSAGDNIIISPHPIAIPIALILHQIAKVVPIDICAVTVVQPASDFDQAGVEELAAQAVSVLNVKSVAKDVFDRQVAFNLFPAAKGIEEFIVSQVRSVVDPRTQLAVFNTQGTIFHSHTFSIFVKVAKPVDVERITEALKQNPALSFAEGDEEFGTIDAAGRDEVLIAEVRRDATVKGGFWVWAVCDNLRRSSALNAVLIAEKMLFDTATN